MHLNIFLCCKSILFVDVTRVIRSEYDVPVELQQFARFQEMSDLFAGLMEKAAGVICQSGESMMTERLLEL